jgi:hypothetical protein
MHQQCITSIRLPRELADRVSIEAGSMGISFSDFVIYSLDLALGGDRDPSIALLKKTGNFLRMLPLECFFTLGIAWIYERNTTS